MKRLACLLVFLASFPALAQDQKSKPEPTLRNILVAQLHSTHDKEEWFVPANIAVEGLTAEQASWTDGKGNHSVGQLAAHLIYWNRRNLAVFNGQPVDKFNNNDETFTSFDAKHWAETVKQLDQVMTDWEKAVETSDEAKLKSWYPMIAHIGPHNAYHIGQMIYVRKEQGSWDPNKGVKE